MMHRFVAAVLVLFVWMNAALAQTADDVVWIQIEAQPNLRAATTSAQNYAAQLEDVNGFSLGGGWYGIALGPYRRNDAETVLNAYRRDRLIPRDAYIAFSTSFRQQFYPVGANLLSRGVIDAPEVAADVVVEPVAEPAAEPAVEPVVAEITTEPADETPAQAQRSERALDRDQKKELQRMLKWAGFYDAAIDGSYGRGTRNSMAAW